MTDLGEDPKCGGENYKGFVLITDYQLNSTDKKRFLKINNINCSIIARVC